ncbi:hypothetical protein VFPPC_17538 [Pochonia chlamydosporia 170]|uniref:Uncharacterized protein n=1 Tax=Pochonia chlamydosporia 170 TaxID=1380566 RepID=A0A219ARU0_METCM|nr:hypothetical protein VFPPC_17538 [Pochonia chlamydosporia 170]OWT43299.1 hypothetical protein VFPPC_17538 [Pochonia chlamydosporia 170]
MCVQIALELETVKGWCYRKLDQKSLMVRTKNGSPWKRKRRKWVFICLPVVQPFNPAMLTHAAETIFLCIKFEKHQTTASWATLSLVALVAHGRPLLAINQSIASRKIPRNPAIRHCKTTANQQGQLMCYTFIILQLASPARKTSSQTRAYTLFNTVHLPGALGIWVTFPVKVHVPPPTQTHISIIYCLAPPEE